MNRSYGKILEGLNTEQKAAVTATEGPVLIVAGAGTGKTKVITTRVAYLLSSKKDLKPENILALTFTDKATDEMQERVEDIVGEAAHDIWIFTFHAFARKILAENGSHIGIPANFKILDDVEKWIVLKRLLPEFKLDYYLQLADPAGVLSSFVRFISRAKDELILPEEYQRYARILRKDFEKKKGTLTPEERRSIELEVKREEEVARIYNIYQKTTLKENSLDFGDLIIYTIRLFTERPNILAKYQEQFKYIVVDEFQDTNIAQIELLCMLAKRNQNICVVGDDDQAIYRFRGASYASFLKFREKFPNLKTVKLTQNYRSTKRILQTAARLIAHNGIDRYDPKKNLWTENKTGPAIDAVITYDYNDEAQAVADRIQALYDRLEGEDRRYSNIAVLYRAHNHKELVLNELKRRGIPIAVIRGANLFQTEEIRDLIAYLKAIDKPSDSVSIFRVLTTPLWDIDIEDLIFISELATRDDISIYDVIKKVDTIKEIKEETKTRLCQFRNHLKELIRISKREDAAELFMMLLERSGYLKYLQRERTMENEQKILNISRFFDFLIRYLRNNPDQRLSGFLTYLDCFIEAGGDPGQEDILLTEDAVQFMTVHSAKGLEFPYVFLISLVQNRFPTIKRGEPIPFPDSLMKEKLPEGDFHREEERRLCYVAMTRAKVGLYLSCIDKPNNRTSMFLREVLTEEAQDSGEINCTHTEHPGEIEERVGEILDRFKKLEVKKGVSYKLPKPNKLSFTQIDTYNICPLQYKFNYVYRIPRRKRSALTFGTIIHSTLEDFFTFVKERKPVDEKVLHDIFGKHWTRFGYESKLDERNYRNVGERSLKVFFEKHKEMLNKPPLFLEKKMDLKIGDFTLDVRIDRIDDLGNGAVEIIDYKTGRPKDEDFAQASLQLSIYALACKEVLDLIPSKVSFYYVNTNKKVTTARTKEDFEETKEAVVETGEKILKEEFEPTPGRICKWCDYASICPALDKR